MTLVNRQNRFWKIAGAILLLIPLIIIPFIILLTHKSESFDNEPSREPCNDNKLWLYEYEYPKYYDDNSTSTPKGLSYQKITSGDFLKNGEIFVSIASYRDTECNDTIKSIYTNAKNPERIFLGICEQNNKDYPSENCIKDNINTDPALRPYSDNIRIIKLDYTEAKGPTYARYFCSTLWDGQEYYLQIDSHMKFEKDWDSRLINMYTEAQKDSKSTGGSDKVVLSAYPPSIEQMSQYGVPIMDNYQIKDNGLPMFFAGFKDVEGRPVKNDKPFVAAGFLFTDASFLYDVPFDPYLSGLFQGEELLLSARFYTNGYSFYAPSEKIVSHHYNRKGSLYNNDMKNFNTCIRQAEKRVKYILGMIPRDQVPVEYLRNIDKYSLGSTRTIDEFFREIGMNP
jgi:hypothetical protein